MRSGSLDRQITIQVLRDPPELDPVHGTPIDAWLPLVAQAGSPTIAERFWAEVQDALPSRAEAVTQGLSVARSQTRCRLRWRNDIDSSMRVIVHGDTDVIYSIVGGPAEIIGRKQMIELVLEKYSVTPTI